MSRFDWRGALRELAKVVALALFLGATILAAVVFVAMALAVLAGW